MKKLIAIIMVMCMVLGFAACDNSEETAGTPAATDAQQTASAETGGKTADVSDAVILAPVNLFDGNIYGGMPEEEAVAYMNGRSDLKYLKTTGESVVHNIYFSDNWLDIKYAHIDVTSYEGKVESVSYHFREMNGDDVLKRMVDFYGDNYEDNSKNGEKIYVWSFSDGKAHLRYDDVEEAEYIEFIMSYKLN